jgi:hypothetical protein
MATFGVPQPLPAPERNALEAAQWQSAVL